MDPRLAKHAASKAHDEHLVGDKRAEALLQRRFGPLIERMLSGRRLDDRHLASIDLFDADIAGDAMVVAKLNQPYTAKARLFSVVHLQPVLCADGARSYVSFAMADLIDRRRLLHSARRFPLMMSGHVLQRYAERCGRDPRALFAGAMDDAVLLTLAMAYLIDPSAGAVPIAVPHGNHLILGLVRSADGVTNNDTAWRVQNRAVGERVPINWMHQANRLVEWTTFIDSDQTWASQDTLIAALRGYLAAHRGGLAGLLYELYMDPVNAIDGGCALDEEAQRALRTLECLIDSRVWTDTVRPPRRH